MSFPKSFMESNNAILSPKVSVILPNYNHAKYLDERILSILNQTYQDFELIILDDCSTDNSREIIEKYRLNPYVSHIVYNGTNSGLTFLQWDKGMELAKGELIWIAESDDCCHPEMLEVLVREFERNKNCVLSYCKSFIFSDSSQIHNNISNSGSSFSLKGDKFIKFYMSCNNSILNASSALFKREKAITIDKDYQDYKGAGDRLFWIYLAETGDVTIVRRRLNFFRRHESNSTDRYYYNGINQKEDKRILDYICKKGYVGKIMFYFSKIRYCNSQVIGRPFASEKIRKEVEECWEISSLDLFWLKIFRIGYYILNKLRGL